MRELSSLVKTFASAFIREIGRQFLRSFRSPFFGRRETEVLNHEGGETPFDNASLYTWSTRYLEAG
jgi:hypothetical protein